MRKIMDFIKQFIKIARDTRTSFDIDYLVQKFEVRSRQDFELLVKIITRTKIWIFKKGKICKLKKKSYFILYEFKKF